MPDGPAYARRVERASARKELVVSIVDERGRPVSVPGLAAWLRRVAPSGARGLVSVALVSDRRVRTLNRTYRRKDYATDVLSFPAADASPSGRSNPSNPSNPQSLIPNPFR